ncbi:mitochondrial ribosomal protein S25-domain-containing protein [Phellopilus nigrolimitatus]|nr:mitochondrial ribosomal protein S25-domain-containing protein [Phellopilus nigrolimitatus]
MVRRVANQVHKQVARLARTGYIKQEPLWYRAVLEHPPIPLPPRTPVNRLNENGEAYDLPSHTSPPGFNKSQKPPKAKVAPVAYVEDEIRRQFFNDHPFEAFRERSLVEAGLIENEHPIRGTAWTRLSQHGRNPTPEDAIRFAANLYEHTPNMPLSNAYVAAVTQYRALRSGQHIMAQVASAEAEHYGTVFKPGAIERGHAREEAHLESWAQKKYSDQESLEARKRWRMRVERTGNVGSWTKGEEYVRLWQEGVRPDYSPALSAPVEKLTISEHPEQQTADFMALRPRQV